MVLLPVTLIMMDSSRAGAEPQQSAAREVEDRTTQVVAAVSTVAPRTVLGEIAVNLEENLMGGTALMYSKQYISRAGHR